MKNLRLLTLISILAVPTIAFTQSLSIEEKAVKNTIVEGYIKGVFLKGDPELIKEYWHKDCDIIYFEPTSKTLIKGSAVNHFVDVFQKKPGPFNEDISYEFREIHISGYGAIVVVEIYNKDKSKQIYTDYLCLYKFEDNWKIVAKTFFSFPK